jgi:flagellar assembly protein FliH
LPEEAVRKLSYRNHAVENENITLFDMPLLNPRAEPAVVLAVPRSMEEIEREAYEKGFESGEKAGFDMGRQKAGILMERLEGIIRELTDLKTQTIKEVEPQFIELAVSVARKIILRDLETNPDEIVDMTKEALKKIERTGQIVIKINSYLYDLFMEHKPDILNIHPDIVFDVDPSAPPYGSVIEGPAEDIVTDVDVQLKNLIKEMGERLNGG